MKVYSGMKLDNFDWVEAEKRINNWEEMIEKFEDAYWLIEREFPPEISKNIHDYLCKIKGVDKL